MTRDDLLAELLMKYDEAQAAGRSVDPHDLCRGRPELLEPFARLLRDLGRVDGVFDGHAALTPAAIDAGRYEPTAFVGEGGLGVVFRATDAELGRQVALKWMKPFAALDPAARQRFRVEAEITGKLEHPGVAPVYGAGEDPDGRMPYYAMRFIEGRTLAEHIADYHAGAGEPAARRAEFTRLLRAFTAVCQTVAYAHSRGVIHRDIKPDNVMLGPFAETLLVDWGLAREVGVVDLQLPAEVAAPGAGRRQSATETLQFAAQTVSGRAKGTPAYMAPEQARGDWQRVGPAADVYALGATLYCLLTGRRPYTGKSAEDVIRAVKAGPPTPVRKVNAAAPKPLAAVCAKAMARTPEGRYASAQELAAEVERWLADEPVTAYRDPLVTRCRRWVKRHRVLTTAAAAAVLVLVAALAVITPVLTAKNRELAKANGDLKRANDDLTAANEKLAAVSDARRGDFEDADTTAHGLIHLVFARAMAEPGKFTSALRHDSVVQYRDYLKRFIDRNKDRPEVRLEVAATWLKLAELDALLERKGDSAMDDIAEAERLFGVLKGERPDDREVLYGWAFAVSQRGESLIDRGRLTEGLKTLEPAHRELERLAADPAPVRLARVMSVPGVLENTPAFRLAHLTEIAADARRRANLVKEGSVPALADAEADRQRTDYQTALRLLGGDKPLPADAPLFTRLKVLGLRLELANREADPAKAKAAYEALAKELKPLADKPGASEYKVLAMAAETGLAKAELDDAQREYAAALARNDQSAAATANKAFDAGIARLDAVRMASYDVLQADLGLDPFGLRPRAEVIPLEVTFAQYEAVHSMGRDSWYYLDLTLIHLKILAEKKDLSPAVAVRALAVIGPYTAMAGQTGYRKYAEEAYQQGVVFADRLTAEAPEEPVFVLLEALMYGGMAGMQAAQGKPSEEAAEKAEKLLASLPPDPTDWGPTIVEIQILLSRITPDVKGGRAARGVERCEQLLAKLDEAKKRGMPEDAVDLMRFVGRMLLAVSLATRAEELLDQPRPDKVTARPLLTRSRELFGELRTGKVRPQAHPSLTAGVESLRAKLDAFVAKLDELDAKAK